MSSHKHLIQLFFTVLPFVALYVFLRKPARKRLLHRRSVVVLVLGDIGRSPRMMYHSQSFALNEFETFIVGYRGSEPPKSLRSLPHVHFLYLATLPAFILNAPRSLFLLIGPLKVIFQTLAVLHALLVRLPYTTEFIIVQNPPSIPTLAIVHYINRTQKSKLIIDWHNLGYSILALKLGREHRLVRIAEWFERTFGRVAYAHLFVTNAMKEFLVDKWNLKGRYVVLHDRPPSHFHPCAPAEAHNLFNALPPTSFKPPIPSTFFPPYHARSSTPFTRIATPYQALSTSAQSSRAMNTMALTADAAFGASEMPVLRDDRPVLLVTSTSWTADERIEVFVEGLRIYERRAREVNGDFGLYDSKGEEGDGGKRPKMPKIMAIVTGKGELRESSMKKVMELEEEEGWVWVRLRSVWLSAGDYPILLGCADLGVSLHQSSSDLDLPMKIVDMFGCGLPVAALNFACLGELVKPGVNGVLFDTAEQLAEHLERLLTSFPSTSELSALRDSLRSHLDASRSSRGAAASHHTNKTAEKEEWRWGSWDENWDMKVRPLVVPDHTSNLPPVIVARDSE